MKSYSLSDFLNPERKNEYFQKELELRAQSPTSERRVIRRPRDPEETQLLLRAAKQDFERLQEKGILEIDGRVWKFRI